MGFKKDVDRLQEWASSAARKVESALLPVQTKEKPVDPAFENGCAGKEAFPSKKAADASQLYREQEGVPSQAWWLTVANSAANGTSAIPRHPRRVPERYSRTTVAVSVSCFCSGWIFLEEKSTQRSCLQDTLTVVLL
jgi:hypothetical protein